MDRAVPATLRRYHTLLCRYLTCPADHPHVAVVLRALAEINFQRRLVKFAWDPQDGELVAYADAWLMDGTLTQDQFQRMLDNFLPSIDECRARLEKAMDTGADPGPESPEEMMKRLAGGEGELLEAMKKVLDKLKGGKKDPSPDPESPEIDEI